MTFAPGFRRLVLAAGALALVALAAAPAIAADHAVGIVDKTFDPKDITVTVGDTVTWTVTKSIGEPHSVTSGTAGTPDAANAGSEFDSGITLKDDGQTFQHTFNTPGTYPYFCTVHASEMTGSITVEAAGESVPPSAAASAAPPASGAPSGSAAPEGSGAPEASHGPSPEHTTPVPVQDRIVAAGILIATIVLLFGAAALWRRVNPA